MARSLITGAVALTLLSTGAFAQTWSSQTKTVEGIPPAPPPAVNSRSTVEETRGVNGTEVKRSEYRANTSTGATMSTTERHVQGPDGTISSTSTRREERAPVYVPVPAETTRTTTTTTTVR